MAGSTTFQVIGRDRVLSHLRRIRLTPTAAHKDQMGRIGQKGINENFQGNKLGWKENAPSTIFAKKKSTPNDAKGDMKRSTYWRLTQEGLDLVNDDPKALWAHTGTKAHEIRAKKAKLLHFITASGAHAFRSRVHHPGTPPRPFMVLRSEVLEKMLNVIREAIRA